jgi:hypothetical protein
MFLHRLLEWTPQGGGLYIGLFRARRSIWDEDRQYRSFEGQTRLGCVTSRARATSAHLGPGGPLVCFFFSSCCSMKNSDPRKSIRTTNMYSLFRLYFSNYMSNGKTLGNMFTTHVTAKIPGLDDKLQLSKDWTIEWLTSHMWKIALLTSTCRPSHGRQSLIIQEMDDGVLFF